jgi:hypothetical protein
VSSCAGNLILGVVGFVTITVGVVLVQLSLETPGTSESFRHLQTMPEDAAKDMPAGRPGNLTVEQEDKLRKLWTHLLQIYGVSIDEAGGSSGVAPSQPASSQKTAATTAKAEKPKKKRISLFSRKSNKNVESESEPTEQPSTIESRPKGSDLDDKYGQTKQFYDTLASQSPELLRSTFWGMVKHDHPDALVLRFLRARKWDVDKALVMLISTMGWRAKEMRVDEDIMRNGEGGAAEAENGPDEAVKTLSHDFLAQIRLGKSFVHGIDDRGRPISIVRVRLHKQGDQCEESLERYTVYIIETARLLLAPPVDTGVRILTTFPTSFVSTLTLTACPLDYHLRHDRFLDGQHGKPLRIGLWTLGYC